MLSEKVDCPWAHNSPLLQDIDVEGQVALTLEITVVIPTYNGATRLPKVLTQLRSQQITTAFRWEVIVCDNNSTDATATVVKTQQQSWPLPHPLRYCFAPEQGAAFARQRAVDISQGNLIAFLDDDNIPALDWLEQVYQFAQAHPQAGAFGSQIHGQFEGPLPEGFEKIACFLAIIERGDQPHLYHPKTKILPPAAGLVVRKDVWLEAVPKRLFLNHKGKAAGLASEDLESLLYIQKAGWEVWYNPKMVVTHWIPNSRLQRDYLVSLFRCIGLSRFYVRLLSAQDWLCPFLIPAYIANDLRKLVLHYICYRAPANLITACERAYLTSTLASPLFLTKKVYQDWRQNQADQPRLHDYQFWLTQLTIAFEQDRFQLYCQRVEPVNPHPTRPIQYEILLRLASHSLFPSDKRVPAPILPGQFFPVAERYGLTKTLDRWVIRRFFDWINHQHQYSQYLLHADLTSAVYSFNLSAASVCDASFAEFIAGQLTNAALPAHQICFEIRETTALQHPQATFALVEFLHRLGCQVTLDDVKFEPAQVDWFQQLQVDYLKLSPQVICTGQPLLPPAQSLEAWIDRVHDQGIETIAKGVEALDFLAHTQHMGIHYVQGYQISPPSPFPGLDRSTVI